MRRRPGRTPALHVQAVTEHETAPGSDGAAQAGEDAGTPCWPERDPWFFEAEVAMHRAARVAHRRAAEVPRRRRIERWDAMLDLLVLARVRMRDTVSAWRAGRVRSLRENHFVQAEVAMHRAARVAHRRAADVPRRRAIEVLDDAIDEEVAARIRERDRTVGTPSTLDDFNPA